MKISVITLFPKMISGFFEESIIKRAQEKKLVDIELVNLRDFSIDDYGTVDDRPYGGGAGMILRADVIYKALTKVKITSQKSKVILTSAKGKKFNQQLAIEYSKLNHLIIIAGHYEGVDERVLDYVDEEVSLGDFVMTGGEITTAAIVDSIVRLIPGVLKKEKATQVESFFTISAKYLTEIIGENKILNNLKKKKIETAHLLEYPQYTRPEIFNNKKVPEVLLSGDHKKIEDWQIKKAFEETLKKRPDLLDFNK
ncbi:MAG: tRNA (guanosine(37)-N1)-methyltransferase TrmD [Candidatus Roizmanbacteria bacterium]|nr:tRNA (guanosine(37)-N1)-methyltransferase TrmD [Candidatus Roizmanbacteria bacterium]